MLKSGLHNVNGPLCVVCAQGLCMSGPGHGEDVRLQKAGEETHQKEEGRVHGPERKTNSGESQQSVCCKWSEIAFSSTTLSWHRCHCNTAVFKEKHKVCKVVMRRENCKIRLHFCLSHFLFRRVFILDLAR